MFKPYRGSLLSTGPQGRVISVEFELDGQAFKALNGGPMFTFTEARVMEAMLQTGKLDMAHLQRAYDGD